MSTALRTRPAFSLVEVVLVLAIMGVLAAVAAPRYSASIANYRVRLAAHRIAADVALTQAAARAASASRSMKFDTITHQYKLAGVAPVDGAPGDYTVSLAAEPYGVVIKDLALSKVAANGTLAFDGFGVPDGGATVVVAYGAYQRTVIVDAVTGVAKVQ